MSISNQPVNPILISTKFSASRNVVWRKLFLINWGAIVIYTFMEWLFFATKPSFLNAISFGNQLEILILATFIILIFSIPGLIILFGLNHLPGIFKKINLFLWIAGLVPAIIIASLLLLLLDNFTYTLFKVGIVTSQGVGRGVYGFIFLVFLIASYRWVWKKLFTPIAGFRKDLKQIFFYIPFFLFLIISIILLMVRVDWGQNVQLSSSAQMVDHPNILLIGSDGMSADHMSVYGYERDTTPNLREFSKNALLMENTFTNGTNTSGSLISIFTGKLPITTHIIYSPDILRGNDAYQHLPGILRSQGYHTIQISTPEYADAYTLNLQDGFDVANQRSLNEGQVFKIMRKLKLDDVSYFLSSIIERISDRIQHIFFIRDMPNPYDKVMKPAVRTEEQDKIDQVINLFNTTSQPLFIHVHMMGTHGPQFSPVNPVFSIGETQGDQWWLTDFYDDTIHDFDAYMGIILNKLSEMGKLENTIVIIYSDHAMDSHLIRIPLIIRFPYGKYAGKIENNAQNIDIAPTILDYLHLAIPEWMEGQSLLRGEPDPKRMIFSAGVNAELVHGGKIDSAQVKPPFFQFGSFNITVCNSWIQFRYPEIQWNYGQVPVYAGRCAADAPLDEKEMQKMLISFLETHGYDTQFIQSTIPTP